MSEHSTKKLINEIESLPVEERVKIVDSVLQTLNPEDKELEKKWIDIAESRLKELQSRKAAGIPGDQVLDKVKKRLAGILASPLKS